ncbi:MAG: M6 family metalloprotease domain-containing protein, partial [Bacteroidales bacterium]|nr:M6 family metalloprotease domain-containing protein [Bacteroidales bacterium]
MKKLCILLLPLLLLGQLHAVPANPNPIEKTQPDGTKITVVLKGDEKIHWMESLTGYTLMYNNNREIVFGIHDNNGNLTPSEILYRGENLEEYTSSSREQIQKIPTKLRYSEEQKSSMRQLMQILDKAGNNTENTPLKSAQNKAQKAVSGTHKILVILAGFADRPFKKSKMEIENLMNQIGYKGNNCAGSVRDFYRENSYGKMDIEVTIAGPVTLSENTNYYGNSKQMSEGSLKFAKEVAQLADPSVDFSEFAANIDSYRYVPNFHILFAGYGDDAIGNGEQIWPHKWSFVQMDEDSVLRYDIREYDGVDVGYSYSCSPELRGYEGNNMTYIGVICHELCHGFGSPDYYDTDYEENGQYAGTGYWDLMASGSWSNGGASPSHINMLQKIAFGWVNPKELVWAENIRNMPASASSPTAYWIKVNDNGERYILENRQRQKFDSYVPGHGLLIYHAHPNALTGELGTGTGDDLNITHPQQMYVVASSAPYEIPDNDYFSYGFINEAGGAPFPGYYIKTSFDGTTTPAMFSWALNGDGGTKITGKSITNISENTTKGTISFDFSLPAGLRPTTILDESLQNSTSFKTFTPQSVEGSQGWHFNPSNSNYGAQITGYASGTVYTNEDWLISPELNLLEKTDIRLSFEHTRGNEDMLEVGVDKGWYKVFATANYTGNVETTTWVEIENINHNVYRAWSFISSGEVEFPESTISAHTRFAFRYYCNTESATWEVRNVKVTALAEQEAGPPASLEYSVVDGGNDSKLKV